MQTIEKHEVLEQKLEAEIAQAGEAMSVARLVRELMNQGVRREQVIATLHDQIASGRVLLTDTFMVTLSH